MFRPSQGVLRWRVLKTDFAKIENRAYGPWSEPAIVLSSASPAYFPTPVEFHPCFTVGKTVYAPATSISKNRNYQAVFAADLEQSHFPCAWSLEQGGGVWHSRAFADEKYGIWVDSFLMGMVSLNSKKKELSRPVFTLVSLEFGRHSVELRPYSGLIAVDVLEVRGYRKGKGWKI